MGLGKSLFNDFGGQAVDLKVHLDGGDAFLGSGNLKVHITEEVLKSLNVDHGHKAVALGYKAAGNSGDGSLDGYACIHKSKCGTTDGSLGGGTVGRKNFRNKAEGIGELLLVGNYRNESTLGKGTVTDLATAGAAAGTGLTNRVGGEIVLMHITLGFLIVKSVEDLGISDLT